MSLDAMLSRLDPKPNGPNRWRCACPVCGGRNKATLSIGVGDTGAVLLKCWKAGCDPESIAHAVGLELTDLFPPKLDNGHRTAAVKRRHLITASQALEVLEHELELTIICASDLANGRTIDEPTRERLLRGAARVALIRDEVLA